MGRQWKWKLQNYSYKSPTTVFKLVLNIHYNGPHKAMFGIFKILSLRFLMFFFFPKIFKFTFVPYGETKNLSNLENERL